MNNPWVIVGQHSACGQGQLCGVGEQLRVQEGPPLNDLAGVTLPGSGTALNTQSGEFRQSRRQRESPPNPDVPPKGPTTSCNMCNMHSLKPTSYNRVVSN